MLPKQNDSHVLQKSSFKENAMAMDNENRAKKLWEKDHTTLCGSYFQYIFSAKNLGLQ
jgi:hypothetical protein